MTLTLEEMLDTLEKEIVMERRKCDKMLKDLAESKIRIKKAERVAAYLRGLVRAPPKVPEVSIMTHPKPPGIAVLDEGGEPIVSPVPSMQAEEAKAMARNPGANVTCGYCGKSFNGRALGVHQARKHRAEWKASRKVSR